jgi:hypothetical protein
MMKKINEEIGVPSAWTELFRGQSYGKNPKKTQSVHNEPVQYL